MKQRCLPLCDYRSVSKESLSIFKRLLQMTPNPLNSVVSESIFMNLELLTGLCTHFLRAIYLTSFHVIIVLFFTVSIKHWDFCSLYSPTVSIKHWDFCPQFRETDKVGIWWCVNHSLSRDMTKPTKCVPSEDSEQPGHPPSLISLRCLHEESLGP